MKKKNYLIFIYIYFFTFSTVSVVQCSLVTRAFHSAVHYNVPCRAQCAPHRVNILRKMSVIMNYTILSLHLLLVQYSVVQNTVQCNGPVEGVLV